MSRTIVAMVGCLTLVFADCLAFTATALAQTETTEYEYDALGRLISVDRTIVGKETSYSFDSAGNRQSVSQTTAGPASFSVNDVSVAEGGVLNFTVTKADGAAQTYGVSYATANGTAGSSDYTPKSGTLSFGPSETSKSVLVQTTQDSDYESNETVLLNLSSPTNGSIIGDNQGVGTIENDDANELVVTIGASGPVNLRTLANGQGYVTTTPSVRFIVNGAITGLGGADDGNHGGNAIDTGTWPGGVTLTLVNNSSIRGGGGAGGLGDDGTGEDGGNGGHAIYLRAPITITNNGTIAGGGGGGGGGEGQTEGEEEDEEALYGGGGGGGYPNGVGGSGADHGEDGTLSGGGQGGQGDAGDAQDGGNGGNAGQAGQTSGSGNGGAAGYAVKKNGHSATVTGGTIHGTVG